MIDAELVARISQLRPWWWWLCPWLYVLILEDYLREVLQLLEDERDTVVQVHYPK